MTDPFAAIGLGANLAQQCIDNIERIVGDRGGVISESQRHMVAHCLRRPNTRTTLAIRPAYYTGGSAAP